MDDEAAIKVTIIIVLGVIAFVSAIVFGLGVARQTLPLATGKAQVQVMRAQVQACKTLPTAKNQRFKCIESIVAQQARITATNDCSDDNPTTFTLCLAEASTGTVASPESQALSVCDKIGGDDWGLRQCVADVITKKDVMTHG